MNESRGNIIGIREQANEVQNRRGVARTVNQEN